MARTGRPTNNPATNQLRIRLNDSDLAKLNECSNILNLNKSDVIRYGIDKVHKELSRQK